MQGRINLEQEALLPFENIARKHDLRSYKGHGRDNQIFLVGKANFQFGDLRVNTLTHHVLIEAESAGGVTNLVKYWYCLSENAPPTHISLPIILIHVFQQTSKNDYDSHLKLWDFLWSEMQKALGDKKIRASKFTYHEVSDLKPIHPAIHEFEKSLTSL